MKTIFVSGLVSLVVGFSMSLAYASSDTVSVNYHFVEQNPANARITVVLSGACTAKINIPITAVKYGLNYTVDTVGNKIAEGSSSAFLSFDTGNSDVYVHATTNLQSAGEKLTDSIKNGKRRAVFNFVGNGSLNTSTFFKGMALGGYDGQIKCKDSATSQQMLTLLTGPDVSFDQHGEKSSGSLQHIETDSGSAGSYKASFSSLGVVKVPSQCVIKGNWEDVFQYDEAGGSSVVCTPVQLIKVKITATSKGSATRDP